MVPPRSSYQHSCHKGGTVCSDSYSCMREFSSLLARTLVPGYYYLLMHGCTSASLSFPSPSPFSFSFSPSLLLSCFLFSLSHLRVKNLIWDKANQNWYIPFKKMGFDKSDSFKGKLLDHKSSLQPVLYLISEPSLMNGLKTNVSNLFFIRNKLKYKKINHKWSNQFWSCINN